MEHGAALFFDRIVYSRLSDVMPSLPAERLVTLPQQPDRQ